MANLKGIDISKWQGDITDEDWKKIKKSVDFVIIKAGGSDDGYYTDSRFEKNYKGAKAVGLKVGAYYFNGKSFVTHAEGVKQAEYFASALKGKQFEFPVYCDIEAQSPSDKEGVTSATIGFCQKMEELGYWVGVYASDYGFDTLLDYNKVKCYAAWVANWSRTPKHDYGIHQTTDKGKVDGIQGYVDLDTAVIDYEPLIKAKALNGFSQAPDGSETALSISMPSTLKTYKKSADVQLSPNFKLSEFVCKCGKYCSEVTIDLKLVAYLQAIRDHFGKAITITSGYRCPTHNANVGGAKASYHTKGGRAADIVVSGIVPSEVAKYAESLGILGIGLYDNFVHIDTRSTKFFWYSSAEIPRTTFGGKPIQTEKEDRPKVEVKDEVKVELEANGSNVGTVNLELEIQLKEINIGEVAKSFDPSIAGVYTVTAESGLYCREDAGTDKPKLCVIKKDDIVICLGCYTGVGDVKWYQVQTFIDGKAFTGFSSSQYLKRGIKI